MNLYVLSSHTLLLQEELTFLFSTSVVTIGFNRTYSVREDAGAIHIVVFVLMNCLARDVIVTLSTVDNTARGRLPQCL